MLSPNDRKLEKLDPFYRSPVSKQKTSAEIISEARNALRTVRTQRPFTPREEQRKLFGPASSRTPESRPPSSFSVHASSFESSDSRPISGTRLSPLELKPKAPASPATEEDPCPSFPKPPVDPVKIRRISSARARLFRAASQGALLPDRTLPPAQSKKRVEPKETVMMGDSVMKRNGLYLAESNAIGQLKLPYDADFSEIKEREMFQGATSMPSHLRSGGGGYEAQSWLIRVLQPTSHGYWSRGGHMIQARPVEFFSGTFANTFGESPLSPSSQAVKMMLSWSQ
uniref:Armadillo repeat containing 2 n=1 Tax=Sus scrofa TaxID=9823 RepID=A0A8D0LS44_PIG